jgi:proteasome lid subunit RPN8/RPN11
VSLRVPVRLLDVIREHGRISYPEEGCGILIGNAGERRVTEAKPVRNVRDESRHNRYSIDPLDLLRTERDADGRGLDLVGIFHSHPNAPARPSEFDLAHAWPAWSYVIVSVRGGEPAEVRSWLLAEDRSAFLEEELLTLAEE